jgi:DNA polymerase elongation subunit (family B)
MTITAKGRELTNSVAQYIHDKYQGLHIYSDCDSVMVVLPQIVNSKDCSYWGKRLAEEINGISPGSKDCDGHVWPEGRKGLFPPPLVMEFEKAMRMICLKKKMYAAFFIDDNGDFLKDADGQNTLLTRGIPTVRRDKCPYLKEIYSSLLQRIMNCEGFLDTVFYALDSIEAVLNGNISIDKFTMTKSLKTTYKTDTSFTRLFSLNLRKQGIEVNPGDRLKFLIRRPKPNEDKVLFSKKANCAILYQQYINDPDKYQLDWNYYAEYIIKSLNFLVYIGYKDIFDRMMAFRSLWETKYVFNFDKIFTTYLTMRKKRVTLQDFKNILIRGYNTIN